MVEGIALSLIAGIFYAVGSALERREAKDVDVEKSLKPSLLTTLLVKPLWLLGVAGDGIGYVIQLLAIRVAPLVLVEPLMVTGMLFGLPIGVLLGEKKLTRRDWTGAGLVISGLIVFITASGVKELDVQPKQSHWVIVVIICSIAIVASVIIGKSQKPGAKAALFGSGAGICFGLTAAFTKAAFLFLKYHNLVSVLHEPALYGVIATGIVGFLLIQSAFQAGPLAPALTAMTIWEPVLGVVLGLALFREHIRSGPVTIVLMLAGLITMFLGITALASTSDSAGNSTA